MDIGVDGFNLALPHGTGVATYGLSLIETVRQAGHRVTGVFGIDPGADETMREILFFDRLWRSSGPLTPAIRRRRRRQLWPAYVPGLTVAALEVPLTGRVELAPLAERFPTLSRLVSRARLFDLAHLHFRRYRRFLTLRMAAPPAIMHWTYPIPITLSGARNVYTIHDLVPLRLPYTTLDAKQEYRGLLHACIRQGAHICTVSEASRADILTEFDAADERITNCYQTAAPASAGPVARERDGAAVRGTFGLEPDNYFLFFGAIEPKKNVGRMIQAFLSLETGTKLVIVGGRGWQSEEELRLLPDRADPSETSQRGAADRIVMLDYLPRSLLTKLIRSARAILFPSLLEGFGLPVLEAMQLGTPVLTSNQSCLPEIAGDAALLIDPYDVEAIAAGLRRMDEDADLRIRLRANAPAQAARFSPDRYRERLERMYAVVARQPPA